jgi:hypothetical protein
MQRLTGWGPGRFNCRKTGKTETNVLSFARRAGRFLGESNGSSVEGEGSSASTECNETFLRMLFRAEVRYGNAGSLDCVRLAPHSARDDRFEKGCGGEQEFADSLCHANRLLAFFSRHLFPDSFGILTEGGVLGIAAQGQREKAVSSGKVA